MPGSRAGEQGHRFHGLRQASSSALDALQALAGLQAGLSGQTRWRGQTLSFFLLKKHCLQLSVQVHTCLHLLASMTGKQQEALRAAFNQQMRALAELLEAIPPAESEPLLISLTAANQRLARSFFQADASGDPVDYPPPAHPLQGFVISRQAYHQFFHHEKGLFQRINHALQQLNPEKLTTVFDISARIQELIMAHPLPEDLQGELAQQWQRLSLLAGKAAIHLTPQVHSEDGRRSSFAGLCPRQKMTIDGDVGIVEEAYKRLLASLYSPPCLSYMLARGLRHEGTAVSVLCHYNKTCTTACRKTVTGQPLRLCKTQSGSGLEKGNTGSQATPLSTKSLLLARRCAVAGMAHGRLRIIRSPTDSHDLTAQSVALVRAADIDWVLLLPHIAALLVEEECTDTKLFTLAREFSLPCIHGLEGASLIVQDGMTVTVDAGQGAVYEGIVALPEQHLPPLPRTTAGSPVEHTLGQLCLLTGAIPSGKNHEGPILTEDTADCGSMLAILLRCRLQAAQALLQTEHKIGRLHLSPSLQFVLYDADCPDHAWPAGGAEEKVHHLEDISSSLLHLLWQTLTVQVQPHVGKLAMLQRLPHWQQWKNSVLLGPKYCTVEMFCPDCHWQLTADMDNQGQAFRLILLIRDGRPGNHARLERLEKRLTEPGLVLHRTATGLALVHTDTTRETFAQHLQFLGGAGINWFLETVQS